MRSSVWAEENVNGEQQDGLANFLLQWWAKRRSTSAKAARQMEVLETLRLDGKRHLVLVRCAGEQFLVGGGPDQVNTIVRVGTADPNPSGRDGTCG